jgi:hypothetical protein
VAGSRAREEEARTSVDVYYETDALKEKRDVMVRSLP